MSIHASHRLTLFPLALVALAGPLMGQPAPDEDTYQGEAADRYAMVRALDGDVTIRKGDLDEALTRGTPVAEGDVLECRGRGVLQLADGTRIAFDGGTRLQVAALFKDQQGDRQVLLRLDYGRIRLALGGEAHLRVDTASGTADLRERAVATVEATRDRTVRVRVTAGRVTFANNRDEVRLASGERISTYSIEDRLDRVRTFNTYDQDSFESWADGSVRTARGESYQRVPREIRHYADDLDEHGDWVEVEDAGWCWRPRVSVEWRPYWRGRWGAYSGGLTWVSDDPFGYVTFHFGRWGWTSRHGWYWVPGVHYSPAWVAWNWSGSYCGWAPLNYWNAPANWGYGAWGGGHCWNVVGYNQFHSANIDRHIYSDASILRTFVGQRDLRAPWTRGPVLVTQAEFRNPTQLVRAFDQGVRRDRIQAYERQIQSTTGRVIVRRDSVPGPATGPGNRDQRVPFEDRSRYQPRIDARQDLGRRETAPRERGIEPRPTAPGEERRTTPFRERTPDVRPTQPREERRTESPRERVRAFDVRPEVREERSPEVREEHRQEPPRESPRERNHEVRPSEPRPSEARPERRPEVRQRPSEPRPAEVRQERRTEAPRERPAEARPAAPARDSHPSGGGGERPTPRNPDRR